MCGESHMHGSYGAWWWLTPPGYQAHNSNVPAVSQATYQARVSVAIFHANIRVLSRGSRNTVRSIAYRSGTNLADEPTGETFDYSGKSVDHVDFLLPENAPEWAQDLKYLIQKDKNAGVQKLVILAENAEKRMDARIYKDFEFALPRELTDEQNIALAKEFLQDQFCKRDIPVLANFHLDIDPKTGGEETPLSCSVTHSGINQGRPFKA